MSKITIDELKQMGDNHGEALILQGCGGPISDWVDGINEMLTEAGILLNGSKFSNVYSFEHEGVKNLVYPFEGVQLDMGKLAMWRIQNHSTFGGTWLSDYLPNRFGYEPQVTTAEKKQEDAGQSSEPVSATSDIDSEHLEQDTVTNDAPTHQEMEM